jgi:general secretion pathway protein J
VFSSFFRTKRGFTLIEILLGLSLTAILLLILLSAMMLGHRSEDKGAEREEISQRMRIISDRLTWLIRGAYPFAVIDEDGEETIYFDGSPESAGFVTSSIDRYSDATEDSAGLKWVRIFVDSEGLKMKENVYFLEDVFDESGGKEYLFDPTVKKIEFEYLDIDEEGNSSWVTSWDPEDKRYIPSAVKVKVVIELYKKEIELPEITAAIRAIRKDYGR